MRGSFYIFTFGFLYICAGIFFSTLNYDVTEESKEEGVLAQVGEFYDYSGVFNVHSKKSSGSASVQKIIADADEAGLDFIILNEENALNLKQPKPIKYGKLNVFYGLEFNYNGSNLLYTDIENQKTFTSHSQSQILISNYLEYGGEAFFILAHPEKKGYEWNEKKPLHLDGIEVINLRELWRGSWDNRKILFLSSLLFYPFNPKFFFLNVYSDKAVSLPFWDDWNKFKKVFGSVGADVTSKLRIYKDNFLNFPGYKSIFMMARNHIVLSRELVGFGDHKKIIKALKKGQYYFSIDIFGNPKGFVFYGRKKRQKFLMGSEIFLKDIDSLKVNLPNVKKGTHLKVLLYKDGGLIYEDNKSFEYSKIEKGVYRVEVRLNPWFPIVRSERWIPWIFSNPIYVR